MNKQQHQTGAQPKRTIPVPRIVKPGPPAQAVAHAVPPKPGSAQPLKPANVMKATQQKYAPWLTTAKMPTKVVPRIP
jgi:hypothetical protein